MTPRSCTMIAVSALSLILLLGRVQGIDASSLRGVGDRQLVAASSNIYIACGSSTGGCKDESGAEPPVTGAEPTDVHTVRCCSDDEPTGGIISGAKKNGGCSVWGASTISGQCHASKTLEEATGICEAADARLCTMEEVYSGATKGSGCGYDREWIWTSTPYVEKPEIVQSDGNHWLVCGDPLSSNGNCKQDGVFTPIVGAHDMETHGVRCCADSELDWDSAVTDKSDCPSGIWAGSYIPDYGTSGPSSCQMTSTYAEAESLCSGAGARLCSYDEVFAQCTVTAGCTLDREYVWTSTEYVETTTAVAQEYDGNHWLVCGGATANDNTEGCIDGNGIPRLTVQAHDKETHEVRCCSDSEIDWRGAVHREDDCPGVWGGSYIPQFGSNSLAKCFDSSTYGEAKHLCESNGARLCTQIEVANGCVAGSNCGYDQDWIWTSTDVVEDNEIPESDGFHSLVCGDPNKSSAEGCMDNGEFSPGFRAQDKEIHAVRCCSDAELPFFDGMSGVVKQNGCNVHAFSAVPKILGSTGETQCIEATTHWKAAYICSINGARLCSQEEVLNGCTRGAQCERDDKWLWTDSPACSSPEDCAEKAHEDDLVGCYEDTTKVHQLAFPLGSPFSIDLCFKSCEKAGYAYFGLKNGDSCWCGDDSSNPLPSAETCDKKCKVGPGKCGGANALSLFATGIEAPLVPTSNFEDKYLGCVKDDGGLMNHRVASGLTSIKECVESCSAQDFALASLTKSGECFCGNGRPNAKSSDCTLPCTSGKGLCGGPRGLSLYRSTSNRPPVDSLLQCTGALANFWGDPHFVTYDNLKYNCQGVGHFVMSECPEIDYKLQATFKASPGFSNRVSVTDGVAARYQSYPVVQLSIPELDGEAIDDSLVEEIIGCPIQVLIGGLPQNITAMSSSHLTGDGSTISITRNDNGFNVQFPNNGPSLRIKIRQGRGCLFDVDTCLPEDCMMRADTVGLLGSPNGDKADDWMKKDGTPIVRPVQGSGAAAFEYCTTEWCVQDASDSLFTYSSSMSFDDFDQCAMDFPGELETDDLEPEVAALCEGMENEVECLMEAVVGGPRAVEEVKDNDLDIVDLDQTEDVDETPPEEYENIPMPPRPPPACPKDVVLVSSLGDIPYSGESPIQVVSHDKSTVTIRVMSPFETTATQEVFVEYRTDASQDVCDSFTEEGTAAGVAAPVFVEQDIVVECLEYSPMALVHMYAADASLVDASKTSSSLIPECCHAEDSTLPAVEYTFLVSCVRQCPDDVYDVE
jgi:hypothetical protein